MMNYATRNSIILFVLLLVIVGWVYYDANEKNKEITELQESLQKVSSEINSLTANRTIMPDTLMIHYLNEQIVQLDNWALLNSKFFLNADDSRTSWAYLQNIVRRFNRNLEFNFVAATRSGTNEYTITGTTTIPYLSAFVNHIEKLGALYTVENFTLAQSFNETDQGPTNFLNYTILLRSWVDPSIGRSLLDTELRRISYPRLISDPFRPAIHTPMRIPSQETMVSFYELTFISFTQQHAFFIDGSNNVIALAPMQRIAYGFFSHVDNQNRAVFRLNTTGLYETRHITLE
jgi:hypothetical protein